MAWVDVIRRSRMRDLQYVVSEELKRTRRYQQNEHKRYLQWATLKAKITYWKGNCFMSGHLGKRSPPTLPSLMTRVGDWGVLAVIILAPSPLPLPFKDYRHPTFESGALAVACEQFSRQAPT